MTTNFSQVSFKENTKSFLPAKSFFSSVEKDRVLIVENSSIVRKTLFASLSKQYKCAEAASVMQALEHLSKNEYALVITDTTLPGLSGIELLRKIVESYPYTSIIVISETDHPQRALVMVKLF